VKRIVVIGPAGAGKSRLARQLAEATGIDVIHLDALFWRPGWVPTPEAEWRAIQRRELARDSWIVEGLHETTVHLWLEAADTVVLFDISPLSSIWRVTRRRVLRSERGPDVPAGCEPAPLHQAAAKFLRYLWEYRTRTRADLLAELAKPRPGRRVVIIRSEPEVQEFLRTVPAAAVEALPTA
jgi:adenylate kinase family enzyme